MNMCYCGAMAGYPHQPSCPEPMYRASDQREQDWYAQQTDKLDTLKIEIAQAEYVISYQDAKNWASGKFFITKGLLFNHIRLYFIATKKDDSDGFYYLDAPSLPALRRYLTKYHPEVNQEGLRYPT